MSSAISNRVAQLERLLSAGPGLGRIFRTIGGMPEDDAAAALRNLGHPVTESDLIIRRLIYRPGPQGPVCVGGPIQRLGGSA